MGGDWGEDLKEDYRARFPLPAIPNIYPVIPAKAGIQKAADANAIR